jgi:membrane protease YdiL (CAAX protease family)
VFLLVGFGEELYFRGILRASIRTHHGETLALLVTSLAFGLAHSIVVILAGVDAGAVAFEVAATAAAGAVYYGVYRATGRLWVPIVLHALDDFSLSISGADLTAHPITDSGVNPITITTQVLLWALALALLISCIRQDRATRRGGLTPRSAAGRP